MGIHEYFNIDPFWNDEYKHLLYGKEQFNDPITMIDWEDRGFRGPFGGYMCDMRNAQPIWNQKFINFFIERGWKNVGTSYYRMPSGSMLPEHVDKFNRYIELFNLVGQEDRIRRAVVFLEDWQSGHYAECNGVPYVNWKAGFCLQWTWDSPHIATNMGCSNRYTLQITGHL
jgi:hypothetical protein